MDERGYTHHVRVRFADTDKMGVVYHARYFEWFEAARTEMMRNMGMPYCRLEEEGIALPVIEACCKYRRPVKYDELVQIETQIRNVSQSKIRLEYNVWIQGEKFPRADGHTVHCYLNVSGKPIRAPHALVNFFMKAAMLE